MSPPVGESHERCANGWICEAHPDRAWPHDDCAGPGRLCRTLQAREEMWLAREQDAQAALKAAQARIAELEQQKERVETPDVKALAYKHARIAVIPLQWDNENYEPTSYERGALKQVQCVLWQFAADLETTLAQERNQLAQEISPKHAQRWSVDDLAHLAACHREDSEAVDLAERAGQSDADYDEARLALWKRLEAAQTRAEQAEAALTALQAQHEALTKEVANRATLELSYAERLQRARSRIEASEKGT